MITNLTDHLIKFLTGKPQSEEVIDLIKVLSGEDPVLPMHELIEFATNCKRAAEHTYQQKGSEVRHLNDYLNWQRVVFAMNER